MDGKLLFEVIQSVTCMAAVKAFLVLTVAVLHFAVVPWCVWADQLMPDPQLSGHSLKQGRKIPPAVGETIGEFKPIIGLYALHPDAPAGIPLKQPFQEISRRVGRLLRVGSHETQAGKLINGSILEQAQLGSAIHLRGTTFTSTWTRWPG